MPAPFPRRLTEKGPIRRHRRYSRNERGDVPGWVMITVMTIVVGTAIIGIFQPWVTSFLSDTLNSVR